MIKSGKRDLQKIADENKGKNLKETTEYQCDGAAHNADKTSKRKRNRGIK